MTKLEQSIARLAIARSTAGAAAKATTIEPAKINMAPRHAITPTDAGGCAPPIYAVDPLLVSCRFCGRKPTLMWDNCWACYCVAPAKICGVYETAEQWNRAQAAPEPEPVDDDEDPVAAAIICLSWLCFVLFIVACVGAYLHGGGA